VKIKNVLRGAQNQHVGAAFEATFHDACTREGIAITRMPDGCKQVGATRLIRVKTPWDFILTRNGKTAFIDTKTTSDDTFPFKSIEPHQAEAMYRHDCEGTPNVIGGYVIEFRKINQVIFVPAMHLHNALHCGVKGSFKPTDDFVISLGSSYRMRVSSIWI